LENHMYQIAPEYFDQFQTTARWRYKRLQIKLLLRIILSLRQVISGVQLATIWEVRVRAKPFDQLTVLSSRDSTAF
jgi:hypothetical protein